MLTRQVSSDCQTQIVHYIDVLASGLSLVRDDIPMDAALGDLGLGPQKCGILERKVNVERAERGKAPLAAGTIEPSTTVGEVVSHVCD